MIRIKNADRLCGDDLRQIAKFFAVVKNYIKMQRIEGTAKKQPQQQ